MTHIQLTPSQQEALQQIIKFITIDEATVFMLNGAAGTGKTTLVKAIIEYLELQKRTFALMAPTGRAAYILCQRTGKPACTIHRGIYTLNNLEIKDDTNQSQAKYGLQINQDSVRTVYIVDEASMIADVQQESEAFVFGTGRLLHDLFTYTGRRKVIFVGDYAQLPPVGMIFSPALDKEYMEKVFNLKVRGYNLREIMRQNSNSAILKNAINVRKSIEAKSFVELQFEKGNDVMMTDDLLNSYFEYAPSKPNPKTIIIAYSNRQVHDYNTWIRGHFYGEDTNWLNPGELLIIARNNYAYVVELFNGNIVRVDEAENEQAIECKDINVKTRDGKIETVKLQFGNAKISFRSGNQAITIKVKILVNFLTATENSPNGELISRALIVDFKNRLPEHLRHISKMNSNNQELKKEYFERLKNDPYYNALICKYAYAITCHKAQGGEWPMVFVDMGRYGSKTNEDYFRWVYTALTRSNQNLCLYQAQDFNYISLLTVEEIQLSKHLKVSIYSDNQDFRAARFDRLKASCKDAHLQITEDLTCNYEHRLTFSNATGETTTITLWYSDKGYSGKERIIQTSSEEFTGYCRTLISNSFPPTDVPFTAPNRPFAEKLVGYMKSQLQELEIQLLNITQEQYQDVFHVKTDGIAKICMYYSKGGNYTCMRLQSSLGKNDAKLEKLRECFL